MPFKPLSVAAILDKLEAFYGAQEPCWPVEPYAFLIWWHCGYPASDATCTRGWNALNKEVGIEPRQILKATQAKLAQALKTGGMVPEVRAMRLQQIAERVENEFGGDLRNALVGPNRRCSKEVEEVPGHRRSGCGSRFFFSARLRRWRRWPRIARMCWCAFSLGLERESYGVTYGEAQTLIEAECSEAVSTREARLPAVEGTWTDALQA